ncbi:hypothetical protein ACFQ7O_25180 [Streptomyces sp. NPDC056485]|uniref:hypothetical protein n=1 Tax=Streptomyces sp. NPDC056485 TaxID=3345834 RepID=UPI0036AE86B9
MRHRLAAITLTAALAGGALLAAAPAQAAPTGQTTPAAAAAKPRHDIPALLHHLEYLNNKVPAGPIRTSTPGRVHSKRHVTRASRIPSEE